jgi:predicted nuclease of predicted toxin-antitoxin system
VAIYLANENVPAESVEAARHAGFDMAWMHERAPGADDDAVLAMALAESRVLVTFDKDFGHLAFRKGKDATCGVILCRPRLRSPEYLAEFLVAVLGESIDWARHFAVAREGRIRVVPLPT